MKARSRGLSVPRNITFRAATNSTSSSSQPSPLTPNMPVSDSGVQIEIIARGRSHFRDSMISNSTATSSSIYPNSTSTSSRSAAESLFPPSLGDYEDASSFTPRIAGQDMEKGDMEFDIDDVQYRLKLLVKNSYFLPPAHSKPTPVSLAPPPAANANKATPTGFLGLFGLGKSKSKPATPVTASPPVEAGPILRTTSDNTTASGRVPVRPHQSHPFSAPHARNNPASRVVVLREKMEDLEEAAKQAEKDIKSKVDSRKANAQTATQRQDDYYIDPTSMIDPTDAVDLPPPSESYPFAVQASMAHGLGIKDSLGAAVLADRLPPSPGMWSTSSGPEDGWRKALLHEAVSHSLHNTSDSSFVSASPPEKMEELPSFRSEDLDERIASGGEGPEGEDRPVSSTPKRQVALGRPIVDPDQLHHLNGSSDESVLQTSPTKSMRTLPLAVLPTGGGLSPTRPWISTLEEPQRAETPAMAHGLAPPPRRFSSLSQGDHPYSRLIFKDADASNTTAEQSNSMQLLRRVASDGALPDHEERAALVMTPPPATVSRTVSTSASASVLLTSTSGTMPSFTFSSTQASVSHPIDGPSYSEDESAYNTPSGDIDEPPPRPSISLSVQSVERPSLNVSEFDGNPSPTVSAFQDAVFGSCRTPSPLFRRSHASLADRPLTSSSLASSQPPSATLPSPSEPTFRTTAMSPPPRASSSLGPTVLPPPPRSPGKPVYRPSTSGSSRSGLSLSSNDKSHSSTPLPSLTSNPQQNPEAGSLIETASSYLASPSSPNSYSNSDPSSARHQYSPSLAERRGHPTSSLSLLHIPSVAYPHAIHSAPAPSSPADFFDRIQTQPNAMDDLETSDDGSSSSSDDDMEDDASSNHKYGKPLPPEQRTILMDPQSQAMPMPRAPPPQSQPQPQPQSRLSTSTASSSRLPPARAYDRPRAISSTSQRTPIMRLGNHSTPQLSPSPGLDKTFPSFDLAFDPHKPVGNIAERKSYFASKKKDGVKSSHFLPIGGEQLYRRPSINSNKSPTSSRFNMAGPIGSNSNFSKAGPSTSSSVTKTAGARRPATADAVAGKQTQTPAFRRESIQRFDGMLLQHMAAERDTLKRITTNFSQNSRSSETHYRP